MLEYSRAQQFTANVLQHFGLVEVCDQFVPSLLNPALFGQEIQIPDGGHWEPLEPSQLSLKFPKFVSCHFLHFFEDSGQFQDERRGRELQLPSAANRSVVSFAARKVSRRP